jgi:hypothetical protein
MCLLRESWIVYDDKASEPLLSRLISPFRCAWVHLWPSKMNPCAGEMLAFLMRMGPNQSTPLENEPMRDGNVDLLMCMGPNQRALKNKPMRSGNINIFVAHGP